MLSRFQSLTTFSRETIQRRLVRKFPTQSRNDRSRNLISRKPLSSLADVLGSHSPESTDSGTFRRSSEIEIPGIAKATRFSHFVARSQEPRELRQEPDDQSAIFIQNVLKFRRDKPAVEIERALCLCGLTLTEDLVLDVLRRHRSDWRPAHVLERNGCEITCDTYNLILKLYMQWDHQEKVRYTWEEMEKNGFGYDRRSYTIMIHGFYDKGRKHEVLRYRKEQVMLPPSWKCTRASNISSFQECWIS